MTTDTPAETETSPGSEQNKKSVPFGNKVMHHTLKGTKNALHKGKTAVQGTVNTVKSTATAAVTTSAESLHLKSKKSRSHEPTTPTINDSTRSVTVVDAEERNHEIDIVKKKEALLDEKEALLEEKGALLDELATAPLHQSTKSESKFFPLSELFKKNREATLLHLSLILVTYPTYKYWDAVLHLPASLVLAWLFFGFAVGNFVSIHVAQPEHTEQDLPTTSARRPSFQPESFQNTDGLLKERSTSSLFSSRSQRALGFLSSRRDWRSTPSFINPSGLSASIKRWNCDPTRDQKHRQLMHLLLINKNLRKKRKLQDKLENEPTESVSPRDPGDSSANLKASMAIGNYSLADVDSFGDLENYTIEPFFQLRGMDVFLCEADGGVPETKVADHSWFVQHGLRATPTFVVNLLTQWGNILLYFSLPEWLKDWDSVKGNDQDSKDIKALKKFFDGSDQDRNPMLYFMPSVVEAPYAVRCVSPSKQEYPMGDRAYLPLLWTKYPAEPENNKAIAMELEIDCMSSGWVRSMAGIVKRNLVSLSIDVAVLLKTEEAQLCLAMWRFDHIDISSSPTMPARATTS